MYAIDDGFIPHRMSTFSRLYVKTNTSSGMCSREGHPWFYKIFNQSGGEDTAPLRSLHPDVMTGMSRLDHTCNHNNMMKRQSVNETLGSYETCHDITTCRHAISCNHELILRIKTLKLHIREM